MKSFEPPNSDEKFFANQLLKTAFETRSETFHVRLEGAPGGICRGANDQLGVTGPNGLPRVMLDWSWGAIGADTCNLGNEGYVYCDATQLSKEIIKRLSLVRQKTQDGDYAVDGLLTFKAFLIKDSYSANFTDAFNKYVMEKELLPLEEYKTDWSKYVSDPAKFAFRSETAPIDPIPSTGLYKVNIVPHFPAGHAWKFFEGGQPVATIEINLGLDQEILQTNPFYYLPFDGAVGLAQDSQSLQRNGYGVGYSGTDLKVIGESENAQEIRTYLTGGNTVASLNTTIESRFDSLNKGETRGQLLSVSGGNGNYSMVFSPSIATPVAMEIIGQNGNANGFFELREGDNVVPTQGFYSLWTGAGSSIGSCNDFAGQKLPLKQADSPALGATCQFRENASADKSHGFAWTNAANGIIALKTIFYTPNADYKIRNACATDVLIISPNLSSSSGFVPLDFGSDTQILSLKDLFDLVSSEQVCVGESSNKAQFFWNETVLQTQLKNTAQPEFDRLAQEKGFSACAVG